MAQHFVLHLIALITLFTIARKSPLFLLSLYWLCICTSSKMASHRVTLKDMKETTGNTTKLTPAETSVWEELMKSSNRSEQELTHGSDCMDRFHKSLQDDVKWNFLATSAWLKKHSKHSSRSSAPRGEWWVKIPTLRHRVFTMYHNRYCVPFCVMAKLCTNVLCTIWFVSRFNKKIKVFVKFVLVVVRSSAAKCQTL